MSLLIWSVKVQNSIKRILLFSIILLAGCNAAETKTQQPLSGSEITNTSTDILTSSQTPQPFPTSESTMTPTIENKPGQPTRSTDTNSNTEPSLDQGKILIINPDNQVTIADPTGQNSHQYRLNTDAFLTGVLAAALSPDGKK